MRIYMDMHSFLSVKQDCFKTECESLKSGHGLLQYPLLEFRLMDMILNKVEVRIALSKYDKESCKYMNNETL